MPRTKGNYHETMFAVKPTGHSLACHVAAVFFPERFAVGRVTLPHYRCDLYDLLFHRIALVLMKHHLHIRNAAIQGRIP